MTANLIERFIARLTDVSGEYIKIDSEQNSALRITQFLKDEKLTTLALSKGIFTSEEKQIIALQAEIIIDFDRETTQSQKDVIGLVNRTEVGISLAFGLIAETGSVILRSKHRGDRLCSTLPEVNVICWDGYLIYETTTEFYADINPDLTYTLITGPSRTADIEKTLVLGAHGPRRLVIFGA